MPVSRGDIVTVAIEQGPGQPVKRRPAVIVGSNHYNTRLVTALVAQISSNTKFAAKDAAQVLIDVSTPEGKNTGLVKTSTVKCFNLYTKLQRDMRKIGVLPSTLMQQVDAALKVAQDLK